MNSLNCFEFWYSSLKNSFKKRFQPTCRSSLISHKSPPNPSGQRQMAPSSEGRHLPPCWHGYRLHRSVTHSSVVVVVVVGWKGRAQFPNYGPAREWRPADKHGRAQQGAVLPGCPSQPQMSAAAIARMEWEWKKGEKKREHFIKYGDERFRKVWQTGVKKLKN